MQVPVSKLKVMKEVNTNGLSLQQVEYMKQIVAEPGFNFFAADWSEDSAGYKGPVSFIYFTLEQGVEYVVLARVGVSGRVLKEIKSVF